MVKRYHFDEDDRNIFGCRDGEYVDYDDYASLESLNRELVEALNCTVFFMRNSYLIGTDECNQLTDESNNLLTKLKETQ